MIKQTHCLSIAGLLLFVPAGFAQYTMDLTGVAPNGASADGVYVSPYQGTIQGNAVNYTGFMICDDFSDESFVGQTWNASATNAGALNGTQLFQTSTSGYSVQQNYDAVAWLANQLLLPANVNEPTQQTDYSFAIWDIMDGQATDPSGGAAALITQAFNEVVADNYVGTNVTVFTPQPNSGPGHSPSQEFLAVGGGLNNGPLVPTPEPAAAAMLGVDLMSVLAIVFLVRRYRAGA